MGTAGVQTAVCGDGGRRRHGSTLDGAAVLQVLEPPPQPLQLIS